jgi:AdoMet-dependent rRNA methyltransferase SPB1
MQLQMTAPLDIGLEQQDATLGLGQDDMFDLGQTSANMHKNKDQVAFVLDDNGDAVVESSDEDQDGEDDDDEVLDSEEEKERKLVGLETELDGLYDAYQGRLRERDAKFKVKEARRKNAEREEWNGIQDTKSDGDDSEEEGGWDKTQEAKVNDGNNSSDDSSDAEEPQPPKGKKRTRVDREFVAQNAKRPRLLSSKTNHSTSQPSTSATVKVWFAQDVFSKVDGLENITDSEVSDADMDEASDGNTSSGYAEVFLPISFLTGTDIIPEFF